MVKFDFPNSSLILSLLIAFFYSTTYTGQTNFILYNFIHSLEIAKKK